MNGAETFLTYEPAELVPPGRTLADWLDRTDMSQVDFARRTSLTPKHINQVLRGVVGISPEVALAFERVTDIPARYWLQLEGNYQSAKRHLADAEHLQAEVDLVDLFPYKELVRRGMVRPMTAKVDRLRELLRFFGVADTRALRGVSMQPTMFRLSHAFEASEAALATWLRLAERKAAKVDTAPFDPGGCKEALDEMRRLSAMPGTEWFDPLRELAAAVGIAVVILKELPKCRVNGATRWLSPEKAMVALSLRHRRNDIFWFTLFHELCHVLRHSKKETFVDSSVGHIAAELEEEANAFAARLLIPPHHAARLRWLNSAADVSAFAKELGIAPGIVVGRMRHDGLIPQSQWTGLIDHYEFLDD